MCRGSFLSSSGASQDRTGDLLVANQALSQLSYGPIDGEDSKPLIWLVGDATAP